MLDLIEEPSGGLAIAWLLEDVHWADPATWEFVVYTARRIGAMRLLPLLTFREEELQLGEPVREFLAGESNHGEASGDPIVLVHGSWGDHDNWSGVAPLLRESFEVITFRPPWPQPERTRTWLG